MGRIFYGWWIALACFLIALCVGGTVVYGFTAFIDPVENEFGWSYTQVSIAASLRGLEAGIIAPIAGVLVDRFGPRKLIFSGTLMIGFGFILLSLTNSLATFYGAFILIALGTSGCTTTVLMTAVANWFRKDVGKAAGFMTSGFGASGVLVLLIVWLIDFYDWRTASLILGLGMWALGIPLSFIVRHRPEQYGYLPDGATSAEPASNPGSQGQEVEVGFNKALKSRNFWRITIAEGIRVMVVTSVIIHVMPYLGTVGMSRSSAALVATSIPLLSIVGRLGFGWLGDIFDKRYVLAGAFCLIGVGIFAFSYVQTTWLLVLFLLLFAPANGGGAVLKGAILREYFGRFSFGKLIGIMMGVAAIGAIIGPSNAGWTFASSGSYHPIWLVFTMAIAVATVLILRIKPHR